MQYPIGGIPRVCDITFQISLDTLSPKLIVMQYCKQPILSNIMWFYGCLMWPDRDIDNSLILTAKRDGGVC